MQIQIVSFFIFIALCGTAYAQSPAASEVAASTELPESQQTVVIEGHNVKQKGAHYRFLLKLLGMYKDALTAESPELNASLILTENQPNQYLILATEQGKRQIPVSKFGAFELPALPEKSAAESRIQSDNGRGIGIRPGFLIKLPLATNFDLQTMRNLVKQGNVARTHFPWYMRLAQFGRSGAEFAGVRVCFESTRAGVLIEGRRLDPDGSGCVNLLVKSFGAQSDSPFTFEAPPLFAELIGNVKS